MQYSPEPDNPQVFTAEFDRFYTRLAHLYDWAIKLFPIWRRWIAHVLPHILGPRVLEISFGTGYLLNMYPGDLQVYALEYNQEMINIARNNLRQGERFAGVRRIAFQRGDVYHLPFSSGTFDTVVNTMAFSGYPHGATAMVEMNRVLKDGGSLVMVDVGYPRDGNWAGVQMARMWMKFGDLLRDMDQIFRDGGFEHLDEEIGGWGSVHLYVATKVNEESHIVRVDNNNEEGFL
jgi:ubiquinone/menaquinone biosynthesis C-methylase UbiE